jgi:hypothetical protein
MCLLWFWTGNIKSLFCEDVEEEAVGEGRRREEEDEEEDFSSIFWDIIHCSRLYLQGRRISQAINQGEADSEFGNIPKDRTLDGHCCGNLKSYSYIRRVQYKECYYPVCRSSVWRLTQAAE